MGTGTQRQVLTSGCPDRFLQTLGAVAEAPRCPLLLRHLASPDVLLASCLRTSPDLLVISQPVFRDIGLDALHQLHGMNHDLRTLIVGPGLPALTIVETLPLGLGGTVRESIGGKMLGKAVEVVLSGGLWLTRSRMTAALRLLTAGPVEASEDSWRNLPSLTERECAVLAEMLSGLSNKNIATRLGISEHTVKAHLQHIFSKLRVHRRAELIASHRTGPGSP